MKFATVLRTYFNRTHPVASSYNQIRLGQLLYDPVLNQNIHSQNTLFNRKIWLKKGIMGMNVLV